jgi:hypothetical protein
VERNTQTVRLAWLRFTLGMLQMFGAVVAAVLLFQTGVNQWSLGTIVGTGLITTASIILFGARPFGILRKRDSTDAASR